MCCKHSWFCPKDISIISCQCVFFICSSQSQRSRDQPVIGEYKLFDSNLWLQGKNVYCPAKWRVDAGGYWESLGKTGHEDVYCTALKTSSLQWLWLQAGCRVCSFPGNYDWLQQTHINYSLNLMWNWTVWRILTAETVCLQSKSCTSKTRLLLLRRTVSIFSMRLSCNLPATKAITKQTFRASFRHISPSNHSPSSLSPVACGCLGMCDVYITYIIIRLHHLQRSHYKEQRLGNWNLSTGMEIRLWLIVTL